MMKSMFVLAAMWVCAGIPAAELLRFKTATGAEVAPLALQADGKANVLIFYLHDCPICNGYAPEIARLSAEFASKGVTFYIVQTDPHLTGDAAVKHAAEYGLKMPVVLDPENRLAARTGARITPEAVVVGADEKILYRGRIDDLYADFGKRRPEPTTRDLRRALKALLAGRTAPEASGTAVGCFIPGMDSLRKPEGKKVP
jgi:peroxiredoxin